jgi:hypothetical protein
VVSEDVSGAVDIKQAIVDGWAWTGIEPEAVLHLNSFGNVIFTDNDGAFWRVVPEELMCETIARNADEFDALWKSDDFQLDWRMDRLRDLAVGALGPL